MDNLTRLDLAMKSSGMALSSNCLSSPSWKESKKRKRDSLDESSCCARGVRRPPLTLNCAVGPQYQLRGPLEYPQPQPGVQRGYQQQNQVDYLPPVTWQDTLPGYQMGFENMRPYPQRPHEHQPQFQPHPSPFQLSDYWPYAADHSTRNSKPPLNRQGYEELNWVASTASDCVDTINPRQLEITTLSSSSHLSMSSWRRLRAHVPSRDASQLSLDLLCKELRGLKKTIDELPASDRSIESLEKGLERVRQLCTETLTLCQISESSNCRDSTRNRLTPTTAGEPIDPRLAGPQTQTKSASSSLSSIFRSSTQSAVLDPFSEFQDPFSCPQNLPSSSRMAWPLTSSDWHDFIGNAGSNENDP
ncbi:hypothetical protein EK21DRAFT_95521 [Setomelanomma holmii]|uniref:Uncharacterized protein n=1 Tax=Setomelanomma holmii TaxID=210430 RepID=A0A9P4LEX5_9PLEO|nr:hypothetical protein EK21DRAFT_95521 [Setomelanomma holmii]